MIIIIDNWKKKFLRLLTASVLVIGFILAVPFVVGTLADKVPVFSTWFEEEHPSGNPLRVDATDKTTKFDEVVDYLVFQIQNFYYEE